MPTTVVVILVVSRAAANRRTLLSGGETNEPSSSQGDCCPCIFFHETEAQSFERVVRTLETFIEGGVRALANKSFSRDRNKRERERKKESYGVVLSAHSCV